MMQSLVSPIARPSVLWKFVLLFLAITPVSASAQTPRHERTLDAVISGGAGYFANDTVTTIQPTVNAEFYAQTSILDLMAGIHLGFGESLTKSLSVGFRFPLSDRANAMALDAGLLFFDVGRADQAFSTGLRAALVGRVPQINMEYRAAGELREFLGQALRAWAGLEVGFYFNITREKIRTPSRKDSLVAGLSHIATASEIEALERAMSDAELDSVVSRFWQARDLTPATPLNEARLEYESRIRRADSNFSIGRRMGVATDQGRVMLLYGDPDRIESAVSTIVPGRRYQLWVYQGRVKGYGTALFLFRSNEIGIDGETHGEFRQVYASLPSEQSELLPQDLPTSFRNYIVSVGR
jgi:GWxTD domain-containing protein